MKRDTPRGVTSCMVWLQSDGAQWLSVQAWLVVANLLAQPFLAQHDKPSNPEQHSWLMCRAIGRCLERCHTHTHTPVFAPSKRDATTRLASVYLQISSVQYQTCASKPPPVWPDTTLSKLKPKHGRVKSWRYSAAKTT